MKLGNGCKTVSVCYWLWKKHWRNDRKIMYVVIIISVLLVMADDTLADVMKGNKQKHSLI